MALKGFPRDILIEKLNFIATKELATSKVRWECGVEVQTGSSLFRIGLNTRMKNVSRCWEKMQEYAALSRDNKEAAGNSGKYAKSIRILTKVIRDFVLATKDFQKDIFEKEHNIYNSRSSLEIPLDKRPELNAIYDEFTAFYLFYDDISTIGRNMGSFLASLGTDKAKLDYFVNNFVNDADLKEKLKVAPPKTRKELWVAKYGMDHVDYFESLETDEDRLDYVIDNVEYTNCTMGGTLNPNWCIGVYGDLEPSLNALKSEQGRQGMVSVPCEYSDFTTLTLAETLKVKNQDLMQILQSRIDLDKEGLEIVDEKTIGGDFYQLEHIDPKMLKGTEKTNEYLIRFECPSTGRPYHIDIEEDMLRFSKYYIKDDPKSYIEAWWHITHGGVDPREAEYVIRT